MNEQHFPVNQVPEQSAILDMSFRAPLHDTFTGSAALEVVRQTGESTKAWLPADSTVAQAKPPLLGPPPEVSDDDYHRWQKFYRTLVVKDLAEGLAPSERQQLSLAKWLLETTEEARLGSTFSAMGAFTLLREDLAKKIEGFVQEARALANSTGRGGAKGRR
jgi:hypothetical protein